MESNNNFLNLPIDYACQFMDELKIALIQSDIAWEDPEKNLAMFSGAIATQVHDPVDLIFLPEMFNTGFTANPAKCAEEMDGQSMHFLKETSNLRNCTMMTSMLIREGSGYTNRQVTVTPDGTCHYSDKRHLFRLSEEFNIIRQGKKKVIENVQGWNILPLICYDLRFPVWGKNTYTEGKYAYDLLVYVSNWPASRSDVWKSLLVARAIENLSFVIGVNRIGFDGFGTDHSGESMVIDPKGQVMLAAKPGEQGVYEVTLLMKELLKIRESFPFGQDWDQFTITP